MRHFDRTLAQGAFLAGTAVIVAALFVLAPYFARELHWFGLRDQTLHLLGHIVVYGAVAAGVSLGLGGRYVPAWVISALIAGVEEMHQAWVPGRFVAIDDYLVNLLAITAAVFALAHVGRWLGQDRGGVRVLGAA